MTAAAPDFAKMVPGFDFLQGLVKNAGSVLPGIGQWVAPTLDPEEIEKRIGELRTVQFWLEQNARMLAATIQALEVQRMTLSTLKTMNVQVADLRESLRIKLPEADAVGTEADDAPAEARKPAAGVVDPTQWWGALTKQFTQLAANAMKDTATESARQFAGDLVKQGFDAAGQTIKVGTASARKAAAEAGSETVTRSAAAAKKTRQRPAAKKSGVARKR
ncbi:PhaM family polyhydroxyalkanoate granule multifunctional regulatory protein [Methylibium sp.]|uniref:PhaM family polyhydroxyalkanoate granule multifunctional regulatory protein n=1 Tax=Methylibium sp. TaxID=2067992 RepID=UPI00286AADE1|nr:PhaM family polyhydroxyalkanoate granule multifunctional regulatory protein [Methylibium sp.]